MKLKGAEILLAAGGLYVLWKIFRRGGSLDTVRSEVRRLIRQYGVSSPWGWRRDPFTGQIGWHNGTDIPTPERTKVRVPHKVQLQYDSQNGYHVVLGEGPYQIYLIHLHPDSARTLRSGYVLTGNTGRSRGPHLHVTVRYRGQDIDPAKWAAQGAV